MQVIFKSEKYIGTSNQQSGPPTANNNIALSLGLFPQTTKSRGSKNLMLRDLVKY